MWWNWYDVASYPKSDGNIPSWLVLRVQLGTNCGTFLLVLCLSRETISLHPCFSSQYELPSPSLLGARRERAIIQRDLFSHFDNSHLNSESIQNIYGNTCLLMLGSIWYDMRNLILLRREQVLLANKLLDLEWLNFVSRIFGDIFLSS